MTEKIENRQQGKLASAVMWQAITALVSFAFSRTALFESFAPFGIAIVAGAPSVLSPSAALGAAIGYFLPITGSGGFRYLAAVVCVALIKAVVPERQNIISQQAFCSVAAFVAAVASSIAVIASGSADFTQIIKLLIESLVASGTAYFVSLTYSLRESSGNSRSLSIAETVSVTAVAGIMLISLRGVAVSGVSAAGVIASLIVISAARQGQSGAGATAGAAIGFALSLADGSPMWLCGSYAMSGLIAGVFSTLGDIGLLVIYNVVTAMFVIISSSTEHLPLVYESLSASLLFLVLPKKIKSPLALLFARQPDMPRMDGLRKAVTMRLQFASKALSDVSQTVEKVSGKLSKINEVNFEQMLYKVEQEVCSKCTLRSYCWDDGDSPIPAELARLTRGEIKADSAQGELAKVCSRLDKLCESLDKNYTNFESHNAAQRRVDEVRGAVMDQLAGVSDMLYDMACDFERERRYDYNAAKRVESALRKLGLAPTDISCCVDEEDRMTVEARVQSGAQTRLNRMTIMKELSIACDREFDAPCISFARSSVLITLNEKSELYVDTGRCSLAHNDARLCGDSTEVFLDGKGKQIMLLCDGMGTGGIAAVDSAMATGLMERLLKSGFGYDCALKIANSAMLFKSTNESLSTVDLCAIDLYSGRTEFYKAGACPTVVLRSGKTAIAECASLPAGIVRQVGFDSAAVNLKAGDVVVMFSDGATFDGTDWICSEVEKWNSSSSAQQLAEHLARTARRRRNDGHSDDITVMVAIIEKAV